MKNNDLLSPGDVYEVLEVPKGGVKRYQAGICLDHFFLPETGDKIKIVSLGEKPSIGGKQINYVVTRNEGGKDVVMNKGSVTAPFMAAIVTSGKVKKVLKGNDHGTSLGGRLRGVVKSILG